MLSMPNSGYEILQFSICDGWVNNLYDGKDKPYIFATLEEAITELQEEFDEWYAEIKAGERDKDEGYDICTFQILCDATGEVYALDLIEGKVLVSQGFTYH